MPTTRAAAAPVTGSSAAELRLRKQLTQTLACVNEPPQPNLGQRSGRAPNDDCRGDLARSRYRSTPTHQRRGDFCRGSNYPVGVSKFAEVLVFHVRLIRGN